MKREGIFKQELFWHGQWHDQYFYSILDHEYDEGKHTNSALSLVQMSLALHPFIFSYR